MLNALRSNYERAAWALIQTQAGYEALRLPFSALLSAIAAEEAAREIYFTALATASVSEAA